MQTFFSYKYKHLVHIFIYIVILVYISLLHFFHVYTKKNIINVLFDVRISDGQYTRIRIDPMDLV